MFWNVIAYIFLHILKEKFWGSSNYFRDIKGYTYFTPLFLFSVL
jgi:hypothetical protein